MSRCSQRDGRRQPASRRELNDPELALRERVKEIDTLVAASRLAHEAVDLQQLLDSVVDVIPGGWLDPGATAVRIDLGGLTATTKNFRVTPWALTEAITWGDHPLGAVTVMYVGAQLEVDAAPFLVEEARLLHAIAVELAGAAERIRAQDHLRSLVDHEARTGLLSRTGLTDAILRRVADAPDRPYGYFVVDLTRLWEVNRRFGYGAGDLAVKVVAERLVEHFGTIVGLEGRRFVFIVDGLELESLPAFLKERVVAVLDAPITHPELPVSLSLTYSATAGHYPSHSDDPIMLAALADAASARAARMYSASVLVNPALDGPERDALDLISEIRQGVASGEFTLLYQPIVDANGELDGAEALIRWQREGSLLSPSAFIDTAEEYGLVRDLLTPLVCFRAFNQAAVWASQGRPIPVAVNISPSALMSETLTDVLAYAIEQAGVDPSHVVIEVTEGGILTDLDRARTTLAALRARGIRIALDDFGTGHSSLSLLRTLPIDVVKIDRSFVNAALTHVQDAVIVESITAMAHAVGATVTAEGVEDAATCRWLLSTGVDRLQGYYFASPLHPDEILDWRFDRPLD